MDYLIEEELYVKKSEGIDLDISFTYHGNDAWHYMEGSILEHNDDTVSLSVLNLSGLDVVDTIYNEEDHSMSINYLPDPEAIRAGMPAYNFEAPDDILEVHIYEVEEKE